MPEHEFWRLTQREYNALREVYLRARGVPKPLTLEEKTNLENGRRYILDQQARAHNRVTEERRLKLVARRSLANHA